MNLTLDLGVVAVVGVTAVTSMAAAIFWSGHKQGRVVEHLKKMDQEILNIFEKLDWLAKTIVTKETCSELREEITTRGESLTKRINGLASNRRTGE
jgi:hypothetical protein